MPPETIARIFEPFFNGMELAQKLAADKPELKIVYTSGYNDYQERAGTVVLDQSVHFLQKPYIPPTSSCG